MAGNRGYILITGGAGFIGTNVARSYLERDEAVHIFDDLSRPGVSANVEELKRRYRGRVLFTCASICDTKEIREAVRSAKAIFHFAAQVAVTTSLHDPVQDFRTNLAGTLTLLESVRLSDHRPAVLFTSTNKVYGKLERVPLCKRGNRWEPESAHLAANGISESQPLAFLSPYGCSKGAADQYVIDYARSYGINATVFRMSCIYGRHQLGSEDQGWVAHFIRQAMKDEPITIYGDGRQVRDLLFVDDLVGAMHLAHEHMRVAAGEPFNLGGGSANSTSLIDLLDEIRRLTGSVVNVDWGQERLGDQKWYVADTSKIQNVFGWRPTTSIRDGIRALYEWYLERPWLVSRSRASEKSKVLVA